jgi:FAD binding domain
MTAETTSTLPVYLAGTPGYREATAVYNTFAPVQPDEAVIADSVSVVAAAITRARSRGLDVEVISTGHASSLADRMSGALLVRTALSGPVEVDPQTRRARIPAGTRWGAVAEAAAPYGLGAVHASSPDVGAVGYLLKGGLSFYGRRFGLAANWLRAVAAGVWTGADWWAVSDAAPLLDAWTGWTKTAPREVTTSFRILRLPPLPGVPEPLTHGPVVCLDGAAVATTSAEVTDVSAKVDDLLGRMRGVARPLLATWRPAATLDVPRTHMDPPDPLPAVSDHTVLGDLDEHGQRAFLSSSDVASQSPLVSSELRQLGGAFADEVADGGAFNRTEGAYCYYALGVPADEVQAAAIRRHLAQARTALAPWDTGRVVPTFVEERANPGRWMGEERAAFVDLVRRDIDPHGLFRRGVWPPR